MATGKTEVGRRLARRLGRPFVDIDGLVEAASGKKVADIFASEGEARFRQLERAAVAEACLVSEAVVATGGGTLLDAENRRRLAAAGPIVCLAASPEEILRRVGDPRRGRCWPAGAPGAIVWRASGSCSPSARRPTRSQRTRSTRRGSAWTRWWSACGRWWRDSEVVVARRAEARVIREQSGEEVRVELGPRSYPVVVAAGVLAESGPRLAAAGFGGRCALVTSERVGALYREPVLASLRAAGFAPAVIEIPDGEEHKNLAWLAVLYDRLLEAGIERHSALVALGGGVVTDLAGFAAATLLRGLPSVLLPTTLLGQIDAAIGGKTGVNHVLGKNLIGAFHQPRLVLADVDTLRTLPRRELLAGV